MIASLTVFKFRLVLKDKALLLTDAEPFTFVKPTTAEQIFIRDFDSFENNPNAQVVEKTRIGTLTFLRLLSHLRDDRPPLRLAILHDENRMVVAGGINAWSLSDWAQSCHMEQ